MKLTNVTIKVESFEDGLKHFGEIYEKARKGENVEPEKTLSFVNLGVMKQILTTERLRLLKLIKEKSPKTIYELAKLAQRPYANVFRDVKKLAEMGLIDLSKENGSVRPIGKYDELKISLPL